MGTGKNKGGKQGADADVGLPLAQSGKADGGTPAVASRRAGVPRAVRRIPILMALLFAGAVVGLYFQPPALRGFFAVTGLEPGGGAAAPIAVAPAAEPLASSDRAPGDVVALGRLVPRGDVITLAPPSGAGDARIAELRVEEGERVEAGRLVAVLDNLPQLEASRDSAAAAVAVQEAALAQTRASVAASLSESRADVARADSALRLARADLARARDLAARGSGTVAALDRAEAAEADAARALERARAALSRYQDAEDGVQADVRLAERSLEAARADLARAAQDLAKARVLAPVAGTILSINARVGEKPGAEGIATLADVERMTVELEVYQTDIRRIAPGQPVEIRAEALGDEPLAGMVERIGLEVGRQRLMASDPAANTDARVVEVTVALDEASSARATRLTGLEVTGRIASGDAQ